MTILTALDRAAFVRTSLAGAAFVLAGCFPNLDRRESAADTHSVLTDDDRDLLRAIVDRIWPSDGVTPEASKLGVVEYLDRRLASAWGAGARLYRSKPFPVPQTSGHGWQYELVPRELYRSGLDAIDAHCRTRFAKPFANLDGGAQDEVLSGLETGTIAVPGASGPTFFAQLLAGVKEGLFADPSYGGNKEMQAWKAIGFPGNPMALGLPYRDHVDNYSEEYAPKPTSLANGMEKI